MYFVRKIEIGIVTANTSTNAGEIASIIASEPTTVMMLVQTCKKVVGQRRVDRVNVVGNPADDVARLMRVKKPDRQLEQFI